MNPTASPTLPARQADGAHAFAGVFGLLGPHLAELDRFLHSQLTAFEPEIRAMADYCIDTSGKRIRPALVFFSGWRGPDAVSAEAVRAAAVVELVHLATLVHDDIMDGAEVRRSRRTAARAYGPTAAVLLGDALFAHALNLATQFPSADVSIAVSDAARRVCAGEIVQTLRRGSTDVTPADYRRIIELKTAELFRVSCFLGAHLSGLEPAYAEAAGKFGRHLGIAYQIYDDLADFFGEEKRIGKTLGTDLASGKLTLPLFGLLEALSAPEQAALLEEISGRQPPQLALRLSQMDQLGVFGAVAAAIDEELARASDALREWTAAAPAAHLLKLVDVLRAQVNSLRDRS
jgi:octaprenyl-diphosphate synthase